MKNHFTLDILVSGFPESFQAPKGPFDPSGDWQLTYGGYMAYGKIWRVGKLQLERKAKADGSSVLKMSYITELTEQGRRNQALASDGCYHKITGEMHCRANALSTPVSWTFNSESYNKAGELAEHTRLQKSAVAKNGKVEITDGNYHQRISVPTAYTINWALFDVVQRLPHKKFEPLQFTKLDHFEQVKPAQTLSYRETVDARVGGQPLRLRLHRYDQLGEGTVPWVYWVDDQGRVLFAVSGMEAYIWELSKK